MVYIISSNLYYNFRAFPQWSVLLYETIWEYNIEIGYPTYFSCNVARDCNMTVWYTRDQYVGNMKVWHFGTKAYRRSEKIIFDNNLTINLVFFMLLGFTSHNHNYVCSKLVVRWPYWPTLHISLDLPILSAFKFCINKVILFMEEGTSPLDQSI